METNTHLYKIKLRHKFQHHLNFLYYFLFLILGQMSFYMSYGKVFVHCLFLAFVGGVIEEKCKRKYEDQKAHNY